MNDNGGRGAYQPRRVSRTKFINIRGVQYNIREWGEDGAPLLVFLHGHRDASSTFQFVVDLFQHDWHVVCPDWRGFGQTAWTPQGYWHQDYLADLDALVDMLSPDAPVRLVGHSLGGNTVNTFAGVRADRVARACSLDGFGLRTKTAEDSPEQLQKFLNAWRDPLPGARPYPDVASMADRLMQANKNLTRDKALFLAAHQHRELGDGSLAWSFDPAHARPFGTLHRVDELAACWRQISCPMLWIASDRIFPPSMRGDSLSFEWRMEQVKGLTFHRLDGTSHNVHHDAPDRVAMLVEEFMAPSR
ncbi:MAG: alpha/beta hydrolase [Hyphomicrobiales bacterium]|nr:alpha/beta hydrolase [Hyphomicrobiales bacterium]